MEKNNQKRLTQYVPIYEWGNEVKLKNFMNNAPKEWFNNLEGGQADGNTPDDFDLDAIIKGAMIQMQHTKNPLIATEIAMDHEKEHKGYYNDETGLPAMEAELESGDDINQHVSEYVKNIDGKQAINIMEFAMEEYGPDIVNDGKIIGFLKHFAEDLGHVVEGDLVFMNTDIVPVHEKSFINENMENILRFKKGYGYWDVTYYPYGGDFKRFKGDETGQEIKGEVKKSNEIRVKLNDGRTIVVVKDAIE